VGVGKDLKVAFITDKVDECHFEVFFEGEIIPASAAAKVKKGSGFYPSLFFDGVAKKFCLFNVIFREADDRPDPAEIMIETACILHVF
jgi:hypothetical protein